MALIDQWNTGRQRRPQTLVVQQPRWRPPVAPQQARPSGGNQGTRMAPVPTPTAEQMPDPPEEQGNSWGRGLGFLVNNPATRGLLQPLEWADHLRRGVTLGMEQGAALLPEWAEAASAAASLGLLSPMLLVDEERVAEDERSNWEKLRDPQYGWGQIFDDTGNKWVDRAIGLTGDILLDPLTYVGGIGFAGKAGGAGGRTARAAAMSRALNAARQEGRVTDDLLAELGRIGRSGYTEASEQTLRDMGVRGGIRMGINPINPTRGPSVTIWGSEGLTAPLSRARNFTGNVISKTKIGRRVRDIRTPKGMENEYAKLFYGEGDGGIDAAIDLVAQYRNSRTSQGLLRPIQAQADALVHESRTYDDSTKKAIVDGLEDRAADSPNKEFQRILDDAWEFVTDEQVGIGLPVKKRQNYAPHIASRDAMEWRRNPKNSGKIKAPTGFFTETRYDPSGVTMGRKLKIGDEFEINGNKFEIEKGTISEFNEKARAAGLDFDFFESDPGVILQKYLNMLSDDVAHWMGTKQLVADSAGQAVIRRVPTSESGLAPTGTGTTRFRRGGTKLEDGDFEYLLKQLGFDSETAAPYKAVVDRGLTKQINQLTASSMKNRHEDAMSRLRGLRSQMTDVLRAAGKGTAQWTDAPALKTILGEREALARELGEEIKARTLWVKNLGNEIDDRTAKYVFYSDLERELGDEVRRLEEMLTEIEGGAVKEYAAGLRRTRGELRDQINKINAEKAAIRERIAARGQTIADFDNQIAQRRAALYEKYGVEPPESGLLNPNSAPVDAPAAAGHAVPTGHEQARLYQAIAKRLDEGKKPLKKDTRALAQITGMDEDALVADIKRRLEAGKARPVAEAAETQAVEAAPVTFDEATRVAGQVRAAELRKQIDEVETKLHHAQPGGLYDERVRVLQEQIDTHFTGLGVTPEIALSDRAALDAALADMRQTYADWIHEETSKKGIERLKEASKRYSSTDAFLAHYDELNRQIGEMTATKAKVLAEAPGQLDELRAQLDPLMRELAETRPPAPTPQPPRTRRGPQAAAREAMEREPTAGSYRFPNVESVPRALEGAGPARIIAEGVKQYAVPPGPARDRLAAELERARAVVRGKKKLIEQKQASIRRHPRVMQAHANLARANTVGVVRKRKIDLPPRPGDFKKPGLYKREGDLPPDVAEWAKQVDEITGNTPIRIEGWRKPQVGIAQTRVEQAEKMAGDLVGLPETIADLRQAELNVANLRSQLDRMVYLGDDPARLRRLQLQIQQHADPGELATLRRMQGQERPAMARQLGQEAIADQEELARLTGQAEQLVPAERALGDELAEIIKSGAKREAIRSEALSAPLAESIFEQASSVEKLKVLAGDEAVAAYVKLDDTQKEMVDQVIRLREIMTQEYPTAARTMREVREMLDRVSALNPTNRGTLDVEEFLRGVLAADPGLRTIEHQATAYSIVKAEELAEKMKPVLLEVERNGVLARKEAMGRVLKLTLDEAKWALYREELFGGNMLIRRDALKMMENVRKVADESAFWRYIDNLTGLFKTYAVLTPGFHVRNSMSAAFNNSADGVSLADQARSIKIMRGYGQAVKDGTIEQWLAKQGDVVLNKDTGLTVRDALDAVAGTGIGGRYREHGIGDRSMARWKFNERLYENTLTYYMGKKPGTFVESAVRLPVALDTLRRGGTVNDAAMRITRLHFDYSEVSRFDEKMRRLIPFWTFMSRNLPLQLSLMYTQPRSFAKYNSIVRNLSGEPEPNEPDYFENIGAFRLGEAELAGLPVYLQPDLAFTRLNEDVANIEDLISGDNMLRPLSNLNPLITAPLEFAIGQDIYTGKQYDETDLRKLGPLEKPLGPLLRLLGQSETAPNGEEVYREAALNFLRATVPVYDRSVRLAPGLTTGSQSEDAVSRRLESYLRFIGVPIRQLSPQQQQAQQMSDRFEQSDQRRLERAIAQAGAA